MTNIAIFILGLLSLSVGLWLVHPAAPWIAVGSILLCVWAVTIGVSLFCPPPPKPTEGK